MVATASLFQNEAAGATSTGTETFLLLREAGGRGQRTSVRILLEGPSLPTEINTIIRLEIFGKRGVRVTEHRRCGEHLYLICSAPTKLMNDLRARTDRQFVTAGRMGIYDLPPQRWK